MTLPIIDEPSPKRRRLVGHSKLGLCAVRASSCFRDQLNLFLRLSRLRTLSAWFSVVLWWMRIGSLDLNEAL